HSASGRARSLSGTITPARMIWGITAIGTRAVATSSDGASVEISSPSAVPAVASELSVSHCQDAEPAGSHQAPTMANSREAWTTLITDRTRIFETKYPPTRRLKSRSRRKMTRSFTSSLAAVLHPNQEDETVRRNGRLIVRFTHSIGSDTS